MSALPGGEVQRNILDTDMFLDLTSPRRQAVVGAMKKSLDQLDFERRRIEALLAQGDLDDVEQERLVRELGDIDLAIAASPVHSVDELRIKIERLVALVHPVRGPIVEDCLEHVLLAAVLRDARALAAARL